VHPGREGIAAEAMDGHDTKGRPQLAKPTEHEETASRALSGGTYSMAGDVVASFASFGGYTMGNAMQRSESTDQRDND